MFGRSADQVAGRRVAQLYAEHSAPLYRFARHLAGNREEAEDLVQSAFLALHRAIAGGETLVNPRAWLMTVVKRGAADRYRDRRHLPMDEVHEVASDPRGAPSDAAERLRRVRATLWALPEAQHQAFVLRHWSGLSYEEIASVMETTPSAVESLLVRARAAVMSDHDTDDACVLVRQRLSTEQALAPTQVEHAETCRRCSQARSRLDQATGLAAAVALAPRAHVAQALAGAIPGFTAKAAMTGAAGSGAAVPGAASAGKAGLIAKGAVAAMAIAGTVGVVHTHALSWPGSARHPLQRPAPRVARPSTVTHRMPPHHAAQVEPTAPVAQAGTDGTARSAHIRTDNDPRTATDTGGSDTGTDAGGSSGSGQGADGQGSGGQDSSGGGSDAQGADGQGSDGSGQTAGDGSGSSSSGDTSSQDQNSGDTAGGDTQQNNGSQQQS